MVLSRSAHSGSCFLGGLSFMLLVMLLQNIIQSCGDLSLRPLFRRCCEISSTFVELWVGVLTCHKTEEVMMMLWLLLLLLYVVFGANRPAGFGEVELYGTPGEV